MILFTHQRNTYGPIFSQELIFYFSRAALGAKSFIIPSFLVTVQSSKKTNQQNVNNVIKLPLFNLFLKMRIDYFYKNAEVQ